MSEPGLGTLTDVRDVRLGIATDERSATGVSVVLFPKGARGAVEARGGAPGTYHTDGLGFQGAMGMVGALFFSGGSLYGLDSARGIRRFILDMGGGARLWGARPPLVGISGAVIFDLPRDRELTVDYEPLAYSACLAASAKPVPSGCVGAGRGARVGKLLGRERSMPGGQGSAAVRLPRGFTVGALGIVNAVGNVVDPSTGKVVAGTRSPSGRGWATREEVLARWTARLGPAAERGTVLVAVATDAPATRWDLHRMARAANDAVARTVIPAHMASDGDIAFAVSTNPSVPTGRGRDREAYPGARADLLALATEEAVVAAVTRAVAGPEGGPPKARAHRNHHNPSALAPRAQKTNPWP